MWGVIVSSRLSLLACVARLTLCFPSRVSHAHSSKEEEEDPSLAVCTCRFLRAFSPSVLSVVSPRTRRNP